MPAFDIYLSYSSIFFIILHFFLFYYLFVLLFIAWREGSFLTYYSAFHKFFFFSLFFFFFYVFFCFVLFCFFAWPWSKFANSSHNPMQKHLSLLPMREKLHSIIYHWFKKKKKKKESDISISSYSKKWLQIKLKWSWWIYSWEASFNKFHLFTISEIFTMFN